MARTTYVKAAQKPQGPCEKCQKEIAKGDPYKWVKPRAYRGATGWKRKRCMDCPAWKASELTSSDKLATIYAGQEAAADALSDWDHEDAEALRSILSDYAEALREAGQGYVESADNIESGFGTSTSMSDELREKGEALDSAADELESTDVEDFDEGAARTEAIDELGLDDSAMVDGEDDPEELDEAINAKRQEWAEEQLSNVQDAIENVEIP